MVRIKHRYLLFNILYPGEEPRRNADPNLPPSLVFRASPVQLETGPLLRALRASIALHFGDVGSGLTAPSLKIVYFSPATSTAIVRCPRQHFRLVWAALTYMTSVPGPTRGSNAACVVQVVRVSGTIKKSEEELLKRSKRDIVRMKEWEQNTGSGSVVMSMFDSKLTAARPDGLSELHDTSIVSEDEDDMMSE